MNMSSFVIAVTLLIHVLAARVGTLPVVFFGLGDGGFGFGFVIFPVLKLLFLSQENAMNWLWKMKSQTRSSFLGVVCVCVWMCGCVESLLNPFVEGNEG